MRIAFDINEKQKKLIVAYKFIIRDLKKNWGADCSELDKNWYADAGCGSCRAQKTIEFLELNIEMIREND